MEKVEGVHDASQSAAVDKKSKKKIIIFASVFATIVVALIVAIVVILVNRGNGQTEVMNNNIEETTQETSDEEAQNEFNEAVGGIAMKIAEAMETAGEDGEGMSVDEILNLYQEKIDATNNRRAKAMLRGEYYMVKLSQNPGEDAKDEILNGLIDVDKILKTSTSALNVSNVASYYGDEETADKYYVTAMERMQTEEPEPEPENVDEDDTEETNYDDEETVG